MAAETTPDDRLSAADEVARRREAHGPNSLPQAPRRPRWKLLLDQFRNVLIVVLMGAAALPAVVVLVDTRPW